MPSVRRCRVPGGGPVVTTRRDVALLALLVVAVGSTAGCYRSPTDVTIYEPGVYKGAADPFVEQSRRPEHGDALRERFGRAASDR